MSSEPKFNICKLPPNKQSCQLLFQSAHVFQRGRLLNDLWLKSVLAKIGKPINIIGKMEYVL
jgi:hypothetical protein